jgi:hypothetical protein
MCLELWIATRASSAGRSGDSSSHEPDEGLRHAAVVAAAAGVARGNHAMNAEAGSTRPCTSTDAQPLSARGFKTPGPSKSSGDGTRTIAEAPSDPRYHTPIAQAGRNVTRGWP